tara:strand:- start:10491 stop:10946 length:456 start_codon:yes stop_codon:yes gene_type:complete
MDRVGEFFIERARKDEDDICFACDHVNGEAHRAHIQPLSHGGSNDCSNLHVLCHQCHKESEYIEGDAYWDWIADKRFYHNHIFSMMTHGYFTTAEAAMMIAYFDGDEKIKQALHERTVRACEASAARTPGIKRTIAASEAYLENGGNHEKA